VKKNSDSSKTSTCTSVVFSDRFVVTAAHCIAEFDTIGSNTRETTRTVVIRDNTPFKEIVEVKRSFIHPYYSPGPVDNDIAVFELERRIIYDFDKFGDSPVCLAENFDYSVEQEVIGQGFGLTENNSFTASNVLLEATVRTISLDKCWQWINNNATGSVVNQERLKSSFPEGLPDSIFCTIGIFNEKKNIYSGPCEGDSGGPMLSKGQELDNGDSIGQTLLGIHSASLQCGDPVNGNRFPSFNLNVQFYAPWLKCIKANAEKGLPSIDVQRACVPYLQKSKGRPFLFQNDE